MTHPTLFWLALALALFFVFLCVAVLLGPLAGNENLLRAFRAAACLCVAVATALALG
jgi:hypothetical protein